MARYFDVPAPITLYSQVHLDQRTVRHTGKFEEGGGFCAKCGEGRLMVMEDDPPYTLLRFIDTFAFRDQKWTAKVEHTEKGTKVTAKGREQVKTMARVRRQLKDAKPGDEAALDDADLKAINEIFAEPGNVWDMAIMSQFEPFLSLLEEETFKEPRAKREAEAAAKRAEELAKSNGDARPAPAAPAEA